ISKTLVRTNLRKLSPEEERPVKITSQFRLSPNPLPSIWASFQIAKMAQANPVLGQILIITMEVLNQGSFPVGYIPRNPPRYSVPQVIHALLANAHDAN